MTRRQPWRFSLSVAGLLVGACCGGAQAAVDVLYSEAVSGDLGSSSGDPGAKPVFNLQATGLYQVSGSLDFFVDAGGVISGDVVDAFRFTVDPGFAVTGISVNYAFNATRGGAQASFFHFYRPSPQVSGPAEAIGLYPGQSGIEQLFDTTGPFSPLVPGTSPGELFVQYGRVDSTDVSLHYGYSLTLEVGLAAPVPEPSVPQLLALGFGVLGFLAKQRPKRHSVGERAATT